MRHTESKDHYEALKTIVVLAMASMVFGIIFKVHQLFYLALALLCVGIFMKRLSIAIASAWQKLSIFLGTINSRIILTLIFFCFLTPIAFVYRMIHGDFMALKRRSTATTYFVNREHEYGPKELVNPW